MILSNPLCSVARTCMSVPLGEETPVLSNEISSRDFFTFSFLPGKSVVEGTVGRRLILRINVKKYL